MSTFEKTNTKRMKFASPDDPALPGLSSLLDPDRVKEILKRPYAKLPGEISHCRIDYVRYKPATSCLVAYTLTGADPKTGQTHEQIISGKCYQSSDFGDAESKARAKHTGGDDSVPPILPVADLNCIFFLYPHDNELDGLETLSDSRKVRRILYQHLDRLPRTEWRISHKRMRTTVIRFKPEKRAVVRIDTYATNLRTNRKEHVTIFVRHYSDDRGGSEFTLMKRLHDRFSDGAELTVPRPLVYEPDKRLLFMEGLDGEVFLPLLTGPEGPLFAARAAKALAALHRFDRAVRPLRTAADCLSEARSTAETVGHVFPESYDATDDIIQKLTHCVPEPPPHVSIVHGDFYHSQLLVREESEAIIDFDRSYLGDPAADVGNFLAHLRLLGLEGRLADVRSLSDSFLKAYSEHAGSDPGQERIGFWTAIGLFGLAVRPFRNLDPAWKEKTSKILTLCSESLG